MATRLTVFYSWQSDSPANLNRSFIEKALAEALKRLHSDATLENALRDTKLELDKDIQGVAGSPPIVETILKKIEGCAALVADLSFVGESKGRFTNATGNPRQFPNPNVLMEYGYALRCHSHTKLVAIMNTAYGEPCAESLPFDLRHLRWPICYHLADASASDKATQLKNLVSTLVKALSSIFLNKQAEIHNPLAKRALLTKMVDFAKSSKPHEEPSAHRPSFTTYDYAHLLKGRESIGAVIKFADDIETEEDLEWLCKKFEELGYKAPLAAFKQILDREAKVEWLEILKEARLSPQEIMTETQFLSFLAVNWTGKEKWRHAQARIQERNRRQNG